MPSTGIVLSLYDSTATALAPWRSKGYECRELFPNKTIANMKPAIFRELLQRYKGKVVFACAFPPTVDVSIAGARWFRRKATKDPEFQVKAVRRIRRVYNFLTELGCPFYVEGPGTGVLKRLWRAADATYQPCGACIPFNAGCGIPSLTRPPLVFADYGAYLPTNDPHPLFPDVIPDQDAYTRKTGVWVGGGFRMPLKRPIRPTWVYFCGKNGKQRRMNPINFSRKKGRAARSSVPRGFSKAVMLRQLG